MYTQRTHALKISAALLAWLVTASTALAQKTAAPQPSLTRLQPAWIGIVLMIIMAMVVVFVSLMSSKRSHQD